MGAPDKLFARFIPKESVGEATSWEFQSLGATGAPVHAGGAGGAGGMLTERERRAFARGIEQGRAEGHAAGVAAGRQQQGSRNAQLQKLVETLRGRFAELESDGADQVLDLALDIARQVIGRAVTVERAAVLPALHAALLLLIDQQTSPRVFVHPHDLELLADDIEADGMLKSCRFIADAAVGRGGCRIETAQSDIDATLATRWQRVTAALGLADLAPPAVAAPAVAAPPELASADSASAGLPPADPAAAD